MAEQQTLLESIKTNIVTIAAIIAAAATIALAPIHFDKRYAHADGFRELVSSTSTQTALLKQAIVQQQMHWLDYYDDRARSLERQKIIIQKTHDKYMQLDEINRDLDDIKIRKNIIQQNLITSNTVIERY